MALLAGMSGCSSIMPDQDRLPASGMRAEIYLARASLFKAEFEQYKLSESRLYSECGEIRRGRPVPLWQEFNPVDAGLNDVLQPQLAELDRLLKAGGVDLPPPGKAEGFADPGQLYLSIQSPGGRVEARTSVDDTAGALGIEMLRLRRLIVSVRKAVLDSAGKGALCGNAEFFGIGSR